MKISKLMTLGFGKNVGTMDRLLRIAGGLSFMAAAWWWQWPTWTAIPGLMAVLTGVLSKCSIYYLIGYSTCPLAEGRDAE